MKPLKLLIFSLTFVVCISAKQENNNQVIDLKSRLNNKVQRLSSLKSNYILKNIKLIKIKNSILIGQLENLSEFEFTPKEIKSLNIKKIKNSVYETRQCFVKGTKTIISKGDTYPRATIVEYIFNTEEDALKTFEQLNELRKDKSIWIHVSKSPNSMFLEDNRIYYILSGGWYMSGIYKEIERKMKLQ
ncbi:hypothetical protein A8C32_12850 [Flavivirga aquatica]|uniref:Uncharacterized protein n=1 Tax=Flavivirga aquatica TaxID=1849968 RepID=A0A1E5TDX4_9FLAO|nr:hypothetical protein [Flavivirga aquatica]OEK09586.1 hypothetical protein A8C32_12850 [Flavivirga aquatica]